MKIVGCRTEWRDVKEELKAATDSSELGRRMLGFAWEKVQIEDATDKIQQIIVDLVKMPLSVESMAVAKNALQKGLQDVDAGLGRRTANITYRGVAIATTVQSLHEEAQLRLAAAVKGLAVDVGALDGLFCENELVPMPRPKWAGITIAPAVVKEAKIARSTANGFLSTSEQTGDAIQEALQRKQPLLLGMDPYFGLEVSFFSCMLGDAGSARLQQEILRCFPSDVVKVTVVACAMNLTASAATPLMRFVTKSAQGIYKAVRECVSSLELGRRPSFDSEATNAAFMTAVVGRLAYFIVEEVVGAGASSAKTVYGAEALKVKFEALSASIGAKKAYSLHDVEVFQMLGWLCTDEMKAQVDRWAQALLDGLGEAAGHAAAPGSDAGKASTKKKPKSESKDSVLSLVA